MIGVVIRLFYKYSWIVFGDFNKFPIQILPEFRSYYWVTVFGRKDDVVIAKIHAMIVSSVFKLRHSHMIYDRG